MAAHSAGSEPVGYEQARNELVEVVQRLEAGGATLEESLALWERGEELAAICQQHLDGARARLAAASGAAVTGAAVAGAAVTSAAVAGAASTTDAGNGAGAAG